MKIYVASSWRNEHQQAIVKRFRDEGHEVYDFKRPEGELADNNGFHWSEISEGWLGWTTDEFVSALEHPVAETGFDFDMNALRWCDACVCVLPSGRSAHLEVGWAAGAGKKTAILLIERFPPRHHHRRRFPTSAERGWEPELMYKMCDIVTGDVERVSSWLRLLDEQRSVGATEVVTSRVGSNRAGPMGSCG